MVIFLFAMASCNGKRTRVINHEDASVNIKPQKSNIDIDAIKKQIALQKGMENNDVPNNQVHFLDQKDVELTIKVVKEGLARAGYKTPDKADFEKKIKELYNCENYDNATWKGTALEQTIMPDTWKSGAKFIGYYSDNYGETERKDYRMVAFGDNNFLFDLDFLKNLININPNGEYKITLPPNIIARNRYFFNGNKADLDFLIHEDKDFLSSLVSVFGFDKVPEINGVVLSDFNTGTKSDQQIGSLVFDQYLLPGKLSVRRGLLKYISNHTTSNNNNMIKGLSDYVFKFKDLDNYRKISFEKKCEMIAYAGTLEHQLRDKYLGKGSAIWDPNSLLTNFKIQWPSFIDEIKKENYYNDPEIKKAVIAAEDEAQALLIKPGPN